MMKSASSALLLACLLATAALVPASIVDVAQSEPDLSILVQALQAADLVEALADPASPLTVFAPTNAAFGKALAALGLTPEQILSDKDTLTDVLLYHAYPGVALSTDLSDGMVIPTLLGANITVSIKGADVFLLSGALEPAKVIKADIPSGDSQGSVIHIIDNVLIPMA